MNKVSTRQAINNDIKHSMTLLLQPGPTLQHQAHRNTNLRILNIPSSHIHREIEILAWRFKTSLPIVKPLEYALTHNSGSPSKIPSFSNPPLPHHYPNHPLKKPTNPPPNTQIHSPKETQTTCEVRIQIEEINCRLSDIGNLPFSQIIHLLKQMMIGYHVLIDKFGTFTPSENMVVVSHTYQWKVWINQDFFQNCKQDDKSAEIGVREFIYCLILMAEKHCICTSQSKLFFNDIKESTYGNCCFVKILDKIKDFAQTNKILQINKVTFPFEHSAKTKDKSYHAHNDSAKINDSFITNSPPAKLLEKKYSVQLMNTNYVCRSPNYTANLNSSLNFADHSNSKTQQFMPQSPISNHLQMQHCKSQNVINHSGFFYKPVTNPLPFFQANTNKVGNFNEYNQPNNSHQAQKNYNGERKKMGYSYLPIPAQRKLDKMFQSPPIRSKPQSPQARQLEPKSTSFIHIAKSRLQLKDLATKQPQQSPTKVEDLPDQLKTKQRKYSEQVFKAKSLDILQKVAKRIYGSNIYEQDPQVKQYGVNVIKANPNSKQFNGPFTKNNKINVESSNKKQYYSVLKGADSGTPNNSTNCTQELQNSRQRPGKKQSKYQHLKANDLDKGKGRNNLSSYYGMGGYTQQQKRQKNMVVSCSFGNNDQDSSKSRSREKKEKMMGNNWNKKISGLFSDDASIKHLKGSVKFKTADEERFEKEYLKDVKLEMLEKFGRPVRHSIVDEQQDGIPCPKNPYKSMQLIQQAMDEGKSYIEKDEDLQQQVPVFRGRHHTVQVYNHKKQEPKEVKIQHRECVSYECSENGSEEQFNFESQGYVINKR